MSREQRMFQVVREYTNGEITVVWKPDICQHARYCWTLLPGVFDPKNRPWVNMEGATTEAIIAQVKKCPSGALTWRAVRKPAASATGDSPGPRAG